MLSERYTCLLLPVFSKSELLMPLRAQNMQQQASTSRNVGDTGAIYREGFCRAFLSAGLREREEEKMSFLLFSAHGDAWGCLRAECGLYRTCAVPGRLSCRAMWYLLRQGTVCTLDDAECTVRSGRLHTCTVQPNRYHYLWEIPYTLCVLAFVVRHKGSPAKVCG